MMSEPLEAETPASPLLPTKRVRRWRVADLLAEANLPHRISQVIEKTVRQTRLWRGERAEVARELIAHFSDGLETGASADALVNGFGDSRAAAVLIRRAKKRQRPALWRAARRACQGIGILLLFLIAVYAYFFIRFNTAVPTPTRDFLVEINARSIGIAESDRAWPLYRQAMLAIPGFPEREPLLERLNDITAFPNLESGTDEWNAVLEIYPHYQPALEIVRKAAAKPSLGRILHYTPEDDLVAHLNLTPIHGVSGIEPPMLLTILLPELNEFRNMAKWLAFDLRLAASEGDGRRAFADLLAIYSMADHLAEAPFLISSMVAMAIHNIGKMQLEWMLKNHASLLSDRDLTLLSHRLAIIDYRRLASTAFATERFGFPDILQHMFSDDGCGSGRLTPQGVKLLDVLMSSVIDVLNTDAGLTFLGPVASAAVASRRDQLNKHDELMTIIERHVNTPLWELDETLTGQIELMKASRVVFVRYYPLVLLFPASEQAIMNFAYARQHRDATLVAIALEIHRRRAGGYPESLAELSPTLLPRIPDDQYSGRAIGYVLRDNQPVIYSVGVDRDDDGGIPPVDGNSVASRWMPPSTVKQFLSKPGYVAQSLDGDWILWPTPER